MLLQVTLAAALLGAATPALSGEACSVEIGARERFAQGRDVVVQPGEHLAQVTALRGRVVVRGGAEVDDAMALGGDVVLEAGARVNGSVTAVGGKVAVQGNAWVGENAVALGGEVVRSPESWVGGNVIALWVQVGDQTLAQSISQKLGDLAGCRVVEVQARAAAPAAGPGTPL
jgi:NDP-sugar pyrophosphorylase family protein